MKLSKKFIIFLAMAVFLAGMTIFIYAQGVMPASVPVQGNPSFLLESSVSSETSSSSSSEQSYETSGLSGKLGSWEDILSSATRSARDNRTDWKKIVKDSPFQLGEPFLLDSQETCMFKWGTYPHLDGSTVAIPMAVEFARQHLNFLDGHADTITEFQTTHDAYIALILREKTKSGGWYHEQNILDGSISYGPYFLPEETPPDLLIATEPSDEELAFAKLCNVTLVTKPVCYDAFIFITHKDNRIDSLSIRQIQRIYSGEITNWEEVGGSNVPIIAYQREKNSGSQTAMENLVMQGKPMMAAPMSRFIDSMSGLIEVVEAFQNRRSSIGYTYKYYIDNFYENPDVKMLAIEGIPPTEENIRSKVYPLSTNYYGVIRGGEENDVGGKFLDWMLSAEGQACIAQAGYMPMEQTN